MDTSPDPTALRLLPDHLDLEIDSPGAPPAVDPTPVDLPSNDPAVALTPSAP